MTTVTYNAPIRPNGFTIPHGFDPRWYQAEAMQYVDEGGKRVFWVVHRRGGKDLTFLHQTAKEALKRRGVYWHVFPSLEQGRKAIWEGFTKTGDRIMEQVFPRQIRKRPREWLPGAEAIVELNNGSIWRLMGSDQMEVVGAGPVGIVFSEFALSKPKTWDLVRPMLQENGGWAAFITTPRGKNHAHKLMEMARREGWFVRTLTLEDTGAWKDWTDSNGNPYTSAQDVLDAEARAGMPPALVRQEYLCDWSAANVGAVYGDLLEAIEKAGGVCDFEHPSDGVFTSWDLGFTDSTGIWFWRVSSDGIDVIDHYESSGKPLSHFFDVMDGKGYAYVKHWIPHDARARTLASGSSIEEQFRARYGSGAVQITPSLSLLDGIQAARWMMQRPLRIHTRCDEGIEALRAYSYAYDEDRKMFSSKPLHDWSSHTADAWRYLAIVARHVETLQRPKPPPQKPVFVPARPTLDDLSKLKPRDTWRI